MKKKTPDKTTRLCNLLGLLFISAALLLFISNAIAQVRAGKASESILEKMALYENSQAEYDTEITDRAETPLELEIETPLELEMKTETVDGYDYIGILDIPSLGITLPVMSDWDYARLNIAPCRYSGSLYGNDLVICAHNFDIHFGKIKTLLPGNAVTFTDIEGRNFRFLVSENEILQPDAVEEMTVGDWDLTLFTCTIGGQTRVTVRCLREDG